MRYTVSTKAARLAPKVAICLALIALTFAMGSAYAATRWTVWTLQPENHPVSDGLRHFSRVVRSKIPNLRISIYYGATLSPLVDAIEQVRTNDIQLGVFNISPLSDAASDIRLLALPFLFRNSEHMFKVLASPIGIRYEQKLYEAGYVVLGWYDGGTRSFYCADPSIRTVQDLEGHRIRALGMQAHMVQMLGAVSVPAAYSDVASGLQKRNFDCAEQSLVSYYTAGHYKVAPNLLLSQHTISPEPLLLSRKVWDALSKSQQKIVKAAGQESALLMRKHWDEEVRKSTIALRKEGIRLNPLPAQDIAGMVRKMEPLYKYVARTPAAKQDMLEILAMQ